MRIIVLDYEGGCVDIVRNVPEDIKDLEDFVLNTLNYKDSDVSWILLQDDSLVNIYNYDNGKKIYDNDNFLYNDRYKN